MEVSKEVWYREVQYIRHVWWVMLLVAGIAVLMWWGFIQQIVFGEPWGSNPGPDWLMWLTLLIFGIGFPIVFFFMRMVVTLMDNQLSIRYIPLAKRDIVYSEIAEVAARTYSPIREYGGWGIRGTANRKAYNVSGNRGVEVILLDGRSILIGSQKPEELALAIQARMQQK